MLHHLCLPLLYFLLLPCALLPFASFGSVLFLFPTSCNKTSLTGLAGLHNTVCSSCWPPAAKATNETCTRKPLVGINPNNHSSIIIYHLKAGRSMSPVCAYLLFCRGVEMLNPLNLKSNIHHPHLENCSIFDKKH